jgi:hypothetical protein
MEVDTEDVEHNPTVDPDVDQYQDEDQDEDQVQSDNMSVESFDGQADDEVYDVENQDEYEESFM